MNSKANEVLIVQIKDLLRTHKTVKMVDFWGFELLKNDELRIRPVNTRAGDVLKIVLK